MSDAYRAALRALAFDPELTPGALPGFEVYRDMIRVRLFAMARRAYERSWARLGAAACDACLARYLAVTPPRSPLVRDVIGGFGGFALGEPLATSAPYAADLLRFEAAKWAVADAPYPAPSLLAELDFEGEPVLNPTLRVLALSHGVDEPACTPSPLARTALLIFRRPDHDDVRWYRATPLFAELLTQARRTRASFGALLPRLVSAHGLAVDASLLNDLAGALTLAHERGVLLGVRAQISPT